MNEISILLHNFLREVIIKNAHAKTEKIQADALQGEGFLLRQGNGGFRRGVHRKKETADFAVAFIENLCHTKGTWAGKPFELIDWQEQIIRDLFGTLKANGYRQFNTAYIEIPKKQGKSELALLSGAFQAGEIQRDTLMKGAAVDSSA